MASVSKCDVCKLVGKHEDYIFIRAYKEKNTGAISNIVNTTEICPQCYNKLKELLHLDGSE